MCNLCFMQVFAFIYVISIHIYLIVYNMSVLHYTLYNLRRNKLFATICLITSNLKSIYRLFLTIVYRFLAIFLIIYYYDINNLSNNLTLFNSWRGLIWLKVTSVLFPLILDRYNFWFDFYKWNFDGCHTFWTDRVVDCFLTGN